MTLAEARACLAGPLRFGDADQVKAHQLLEAVEALCDADIGICAACKGEGQIDDLECGVCDGMGLVDHDVEPYKGCSLEVRRAFRERQHELYPLAEFTR